MAIEYMFQLNSTTAPEAVGELLVPPLVAVAWRAPVSAYKSAGGLLVTVRLDGTADFVLEEPEISVGFRFDKFADFEVQNAEMVRLVVAVLAAEGGDAVLQQDFERILLLRRGSELLLGESFWTAEMLALVPWEYTRRALPYPED
ncbi:SitI3 family protein [Kribbella sp. NPDC058245]|uniref:SitI3 family protein n=1 Tax=Kribbella sp. NPDC058245 TaxID=3346399 RepID=UPI0036EEBED6